MFSKAFMYAATGVLLASSAHATTFSGMAVGSWSSPSATGSVYTISNNDNTAFTNGLASFNFGTAAGFGDTSNLLTFDGVGTVNNGTPFTASQNSPFVLGNFSYRNGTTSTDSYPSGDSAIKLGVALTLSAPSGVPSSSYNYNFTIDITPNLTGNPVLDADTLTIANGTTSSTFTTGGQTYTLALLGFSTNNGVSFTNTFVAPEETTSTAKLYATITTNVPEPASLSLLGAGLLGAGLIRRRTV